MHTASLPTPFSKASQEIGKLPDTHALRLTHTVCDCGLISPPSQRHPLLDLWT